MLISIDDFLKLYGNASKHPNDQQREIISASSDESLHIVAGPGTGKTASIAARILKLIFVDGIRPDSILATTFTVRSSEELKSRVLSVGFRVREQMAQANKGNQRIEKKLHKIDLNQINIGTIDSICEVLLKNYRNLEDQSVIIADQYFANTVYLLHGVFARKAQDSDELNSYLANFATPRWGRFKANEIIDLTRSFWERRFHDQIDWNKFVAENESKHPGINDISKIHEGYANRLNELQMLDFCLLEQRLLDSLVAKKMVRFCQNLKYLFVDEYQDSNALQERIYFELISQSGAPIVVVGDDDQSLYRFRGATVELFTQFPERFESAFKRKPVTIFLKDNYRSSEKIVSFVSEFSELDKSYQEVRVSQKPRLVAKSTSSSNISVLGMFRNSKEELAKDLSNFIKSVFFGGGFKLLDGNIINVNDIGGAVGDCALLTHSPAVKKYNGELRLPGLLAAELSSGDIKVGVLNPRGQDLNDNPLLITIGGLFLECIDPDKTIQNDVKISRDSKDGLDAWRLSAKNILKLERFSKLKDYVSGWARRDPGVKGAIWPKFYSALELIYVIVHFFPEIYNDPEGQLILETFTRQLNVSGMIGKFRGDIFHDSRSPEREKYSLSELYRYFLDPIVSGTVQINENLIDSFPRNRLPILSVHQSKGLEFPLVMVDIGSDFSMDHSTQRRQRFPDRAELPQLMEDNLRGFSRNLKVPGRPPLDRLFDDLTRQSFVAFSRAQDVLLLVGLRRSGPFGDIPNVSAGWSRQGIQFWNQKNNKIMEI